MNRYVIMSGADDFNDDFAINDLMDSNIPVDGAAAVAEHDLIRQTLENNGVKVHKVDAPTGCQDGVYTANWALVRNGKALMSRLPNKRKDEGSYAIEAVKEVGLKPLTLPKHVERFSGQGDALACGNVVFTQSPFRTVVEAHYYIKEWLGFEEVVALETEPAYDSVGQPVINAITGWPDSPTYDIDLAIAILKWPENDQKGLIAWCPEVFKPASQVIMRAYDKVDKIEVSKDEAMGAYALNLLSTGETVVMNSGAPNFQAAIETAGLKTVTLELPELRKGGGSIRCSTLSLDNN